MRIDCPHGWRHSARVGSIVLEDSRVEIHGGICDSPDLCGIRTCVFFNDSPEGDQRYRRACYHARTIEGMRVDERAKREYEERRQAGDTFTRPRPFEKIEPRRGVKPGRDDDDGPEIPAEVVDEMVRDDLAEVVIGEDEIGVRPTAKGRQLVQRDRDFDGNMAELVDKGYAEPVGTNADGETLYRLTAKAEAESIEIEKRERRRASRARAAAARLERELPRERQFGGITVVPIRTLAGKVRTSFRVDPWKYLDPSGSVAESGRSAYPDVVRYLKWIIGFGSTGEDDKRRASPIQCWRETRDRFTGEWKRCHGQLHVTRDDVGRYPEDPRPGIWWVCGGCWLVGVIERWQGTAFDGRGAAA